MARIPGARASDGQFLWSSYRKSYLQATQSLYPDICFHNHSLRIVSYISGQLGAHICIRCLHAYNCKGRLICYDELNLSTMNFFALKRNMVTVTMTCIHGKLIFCC